MSRIYPALPNPGDAQSGRPDRPSAPAPAPQAPPALGAGGGAPQGRRVSSPALMGLLLLACLYTFWVARDILMPLALAVVLAMILAPITAALRRLRVPEWLGAAIVLVALLGLLILGLFALSYPAAEWLDRGAGRLGLIEQRVRELLRPIGELQQAGRRIVGGAAEAGSPEAPGPDVPGFVLTWTQGLVIAGALTIALLYFLLASGDLFLRKLVTVLPRLEDKRRAVEIAGHVQHDISAYLLTITLINAGLGIVTGLAMWLMGMPSPVLWGVMAALLNYIPYIGAIIAIIVLGMVALVTFDEPGYALLVAGIYYFLTAIEGNFVVPMVLGRRLMLNPVVVFVGLIFWGWIWGVMGAILAVPLLSIVKIVCDRVEPWKPVGEFLGR